jgi:hypothetical protein
MVTVTKNSTRLRKDGTTFQVLELTGGLELIQSQETGKFYATVRKTTIPCTFDENTAKGLIGTQMKGDVVRVQVDPYDFVNPKTGEIIKLQHSYSYQPEGSSELIGSRRIEALEMA